jgi:acetyl esterase/lipase
MTSAPAGAPLRAVGRVALWTVATVTVVFTVLAQLLAVVPVSWTMPLLQWEVSQYLVILLGVLRDSLGVWNVVVGAVGVVSAATLWRRRPRPRRRLPLVLTVVGSAGAVTAVAIASTGAGTSPLLPTLPFTGLTSGPSRTVTVGTAGTTTLRADLYLPSGRAPRAGWPVVVSVHGGGFSTGSRGPNAYTGYLPAHGYAVLDVDYRLASPTYHPWRTQVEDVGCSLAWVARAGRSHHLDADRVAMLGLSSGGNLAVNAAYTSAEHTLRSSCSPSGSTLPVVRAVIAGYPAVDLSGIGDRTAIARKVEQWCVGGTPAEYPERYRSTDSATHVSADSPPTLVYQGARDHLVLADRTRAFVDVLARHGVPHRYVQYPGMEHSAGDSTSTLTPAAAASRRLTLDWLQRYDGARRSSPTTP